MCAYVCSSFVVNTCNETFHSLQILMVFFSSFVVFFLLFRRQIKFYRPSAFPPWRIYMWRSWAPPIVSRSYLHELVFPYEYYKLIKAFNEEFSFPTSGALLFELPALGGVAGVVCKKNKKIKTNRLDDLRYYCKGRLCFNFLRYILVCTLWTSWIMVIFFFETNVSVMNSPWCYLELFSFIVFFILCWKVYCSCNAFHNGDPTSYSKTLSALLCAATFIKKLCPCDTMFVKPW